MMLSNKHILVLTIFIFFVIPGCSTTERGVEDRSAADSTYSTLEDLTSLDFLLYMSRSSLSDLHTSQQHDMPDVFMQKKSGGDAINSNPFDGYRIQIISTKSIELADSIANDFRIWSDTTISGYVPNSYVFFRQPYYKVHVGDFQQREQASSFSQLLKDKYPAAWVVHDRIEPSQVPADTAIFSIITREDRIRKMKQDSLRNR